jgi:hypothetical protein
MYFITIEQYSVVGLFIICILAIWRLSLNFFTMPRKNALYNSYKWQGPVAAEHKIIRLCEVGCHDAVSSSMCVVQQRPPLHWLVLYPLLKVFYLPSPPFSLYRAGQIRASRKDLEVPRQRVLFLLLFVQKLSAYVLLVCCRRLSCSFPLHNLLLSELLKIAPEKIVLPLLVLDALLREEINKALTPEL